MFGVGAIAIHIYEPRLGILLYPKAHWEPVIWRNVTAPELIESVYQGFGVTVNGMYYG